MCAVAPQTVSSSSSKKCNVRSVGPTPQTSDRYVSGRVSSRSGTHSTRSTSIVLRFERHRLGDGRDLGHDVAAADDGVQVLELASHLDGPGASPTSS